MLLEILEQVFDQLSNSIFLMKPHTTEDQCQYFDAPAFDFNKPSD